MRKEIEEEMKAKYQPTQEKPEVNEAKVIMKTPEVIKQPTARELFEASYADIRRAEREAHIEKIECFKSKLL